ncbi:MAG: NADPH:quinone oxidoreductase family protein [Betaproteobacteria bacterium]|jgi:NADPH:quinone reductase|nr:NADPH:quinone oxidoreductase family protein [Betaproteobacteria bacterium]MBT6412140.1 NADPH:quinone oxidoreductase family protein [Betaproteobacteria bacterium]MCH1424421.1 NADPH:quinone oxidoreductase family protein [Burkholderiales bacterium]MDG1143954.1 NADPH:quinone oxidoreductase family protein [Burkholderiales bacterium]
MRAVLCKELGMPESLVLEEVPGLIPGPGQVLISVQACGVNFPDTLIIQGKYQFKPDLPFSPGGEISGVVKQVGSDVDSLKIGDRVIAFSTWGGFAEELVVDQTRTVIISDKMDYERASAFVLTYGTSYHALKDRAHLREGETLLVLGASGGVGLAAIQLGKAMGATVIAAASNPEKLSACQENGADYVINYAQDDLRQSVKEITKGRGVDVIYDPVGGSFSEKALRDMSWGGRFLVVGFAAGEIPKVPLNIPLLKGCSVVGVFWGEFTKREPDLNKQNNQELMDLFDQGKISPHIHRVYPLEKAGEALNELLQKRVIGKVVLSTTV